MSPMTKKYDIGRAAIKENTKIKLWALSAGRCEICNKLLFKDNSFGLGGNFSNVAHIIGVGKNGPRSSKDLGKDKNNFDNLMLLCTTCHHAIDSNTEYFTEGFLVDLKKKHEARVEFLTAIDSSKGCQLVKYFLNVNEAVKQYTSENEMLTAVADLSLFPKQNMSIDLNDDNGAKYIPSKESILQKSRELEEEFNKTIKHIHEESLAIFAFACQPLLFKLGSLFGDQRRVFVFQPQRGKEEKRWSFSSEKTDVKFIMNRVFEETKKQVALVLDLSAPIVNERITNVLGEKVNIYHLTIDCPNRNFVNSLRVQDRFVEFFRQTIERIKNENPEIEVINIFPAMPISLAIMAGMDYMPKVDLKWLIYEQSNKDEGFYPTVTIGD